MSDAYTDRFWDALEDDRFLLGDCDDCGDAHFPPAPVCPHCGAEAGWREAAGHGELYSFARQHRTAPGFDAPLTVGLVELPEGPRVLTRIDADYDALEIGREMAIRAREYEGGFDRGRLADAPMFVAEPR
jgi:uncharacterized OB-fold protein